MRQQGTIEEAERLLKLGMGTCFKSLIHSRATGFTDTAAKEVNRLTVSETAKRSCATCWNAATTCTDRE